MLLLKELLQTKAKLTFFSLETAKISLVTWFTPGAAQMQCIMVKSIFVLKSEGPMRGTSEGLMGGMSLVTSSDNCQVRISHVLVIPWIGSCVLVAMC